MKKEKEIEERIKFFENLLHTDDDLPFIMGSNQRAKIRDKIDTLKWVLDKEKKEDLK